MNRFFFALCILHLDNEFVFFVQSENNGTYFFCQHGPAECTGNRLQSCVVDALGNDQDAIVKFVTCQMKWNAEYTGESVRIIPR